MLHQCAIHILLFHYIYTITSINSLNIVTCVAFCIIYISFYSSRRNIIIIHFYNQMKEVFNIKVLQYMKLYPSLFLYSTLCQHISMNILITGFLQNR